MTRYELYLCIFLALIGAVLAYLCALNAWATPILQWQRSWWLIAGALLFCFGYVPVWAVTMNIPLWRCILPVFIGISFPLWGELLAVLFLYDWFYVFPHAAFTGCILYCSDPQKRLIPGTLPVLALVLSIACSLMTSSLMGGTHVVSQHHWHWHLFFGLEIVVWNVALIACHIGYCAVVHGLASRRS